MKLTLFALRSLLRTPQRSVATVLAIGVSLCALNLLGAYIGGIHGELESAAVDGERLGHLTIFKRGMREEGKLNPQRNMFDADEARALQRAVEGSAGVALCAPHLSLNGIAAGAHGAAIFVGDGGVGAAPDRRNGRLNPALRQGVALSATLAAMLRLSTGSALTLTAASLDARTRSVEAEVVDIFHTGDPASNDKTLLMPLALAQSLQDTVRTERFVVHLSDPAQTEAMRANLTGRLRGAGLNVDIRTWRELSTRYQTTRRWFALMFSFSAGMVLTVAAMSVGATISMNALERVREVGTLRALGMDGADVVVLFAMEALWLAMLGVAISLITTGVIAWVVNRAGLYYLAPNALARAPFLLEPDHPRMLGMAAAVLSLALVAALVPALRAARRGIGDALTGAAAAN